MRILITNDDGIQASQLVPLVTWARKLGEVVVAAPKVEQSGKSHGIEIHKPFEVKQLELLPGVRAYAVDSTPADCVRFAILGLHETFDLVISGINRGLNIGRDIMYSGTVSAVMEAANLGVQAVAISTDPAVYERAVERLDEVLAFFREHQLLKIHDIYNINIPVQVRGFRITRQGGPYYSDDFIPQENNIVLPRGKDVFEPSGSMDIDTDAVLLGGYISVMPLTLERTDMRIFETLHQLNE
ncbi:MAG: 5'/3'-nucleotidase SurE [Oscillospiraceae bacterium]|nr:5'/3'-nucleotidase SurE [Oscillospiraceae bacterium]